MMPIPESRETLLEQQRQLMAGDRDVQMFPAGHPELKLPRGMQRLKVGGNVFHYNKKRITPKKIIAASKAGRENELLGLGPVSKIEAVERAKKGEKPVAIVERTPKGVEARAAAGTDKTASAQMADMERVKSPGNVVGVEGPDETIARRFADGGEVDPLTGAVTPSAQGQEKFNKIADALASGARHWIEAPGRAMREGITTEQAVDWAAPTALGMVAGSRLPGAAPEGAVGAAGAKLVQPEGIRAYHGSPYDFDKFSLLHIGKGEGAQAYGHGLYFAGNEKVAQQYRDTLSAQQNAMQRQKFQGGVDHAYEAAAQDFLKHGYSQADALSGLKGVYKNARDGELEAALNNVLSGGRGRMYEVNINARPEQFLDWDKPLRDQPVADAVRSLVPQDLRKPFDYNVDKGGIQGANAYMNYVPSQSFPIRDTPSSPWRASGASSYEDALALVGGDTKRVNRLLTPDRAASSERLAEAGIPGIKYLDQGSRNPGFSSLTPAQLDARIETLRADIASGGGNQQRMRDQLAGMERERDTYRNQTHNYVVFNDKLIDILRKYGIAGAAAPALAQEIMSQGKQHFAQGGAVHMADGGLPPLPEGFTLDNSSSTPPLPQGFTLDAAPSTPAAAPSNTPAAPASWSDVPLAAAKNVIPSAVKFGQDLAHPFMHPAETATGLKNLALGVAEKTGLKSGDENVKYADAVGQFFADRYGGVDNLKNTLANDPVGFAADLSLLLSGGASLPARAPGVIGKTAEVVGQVGRAVDPLTAAAQGVKAVGSGAAGVVGGLGTHTGGETLRLAAQAGQRGGEAARAFQENLRGAAPIDDVVAEARNAVGKLRQERGAEYKAGMQSVAADKTVLDFDKIDDALVNISGVKTFHGQNISPSTQAIRQQIGEAIRDWKALDPATFHTAEGLDALKQKIGDIKDATQYGTPERVVANGAYNAIRQTIVDQAPQYARVMKGYEEASKQIKEIERTLSLNPNASVDTALRKLQSVLRNNVNTNYGSRKQLAEFLVNAGAPNLMQKLAGQSLSSWTPRGLGKLGMQLGAEIAAIGAGTAAAGASGAAAGAALLPFMSPRLMGETAYYLGKASNAPVKAGAHTSFQAGRESEVIPWSRP